MIDQAEVIPQTFTRSTECSQTEVSISFYLIVVGGGLEYPMIPRAKPAAANGRVSQARKVEAGKGSG